jgi:transposase
MRKTYRDWSPNQSYLFPPAPQDWLPEDDLVYFLLDTVATIDLSPIFAHYQRELRGQPPFHPRMMVALLLYCYATGTRSSRKIMRRCRTDVACRIIVGEDVPDFRTISDFRKTHLARLEALFVEVLKLCALAGLAKVGTVALDGTKIKANASRHKAMSYERMKQEEERLKGEVARLLAEAEASDAAEDAAHGQGQRISMLLKSQDFREEARVHQAPHHLAAEAVLDRMTLQERHGEAPQPTQVVAKSPLAGAAVILPEVHVEHPMHRLDGPMAPYRLAEALAAEITAEDVVPRLVGLMAVGVSRHP